MMKTDIFEYIKKRLYEYGIDVDSHKYIIDYSYEPRGAIYRYSDGQNSKNFNIYVRVSSNPEILELYKKYLTLIKPAIVRKRK